MGVIKCLYYLNKWCEIQYYSIKYVINNVGLIVL